MTEHALPTPDGVIRYHSEGDGPPVVFVHGTPSHGGEFADAMARLAPHHRCIAMDHLGFGTSDKPSGADYGVAAHQRRLAQVLDALDLHDATFVLHDFGTAFAMPWLTANADRVRSVVLANTFAWTATGPMRWVLRFYSTRFGRWLYRRFNVSAKLLLPWAWGTRRPLTPEVHAAFLAPFTHVDDRHATSSLTGALLAGSLEALEPATLNRWPVHAVWGMADPLVGPPELARWRALLPDLPVTEIHDAGHFVAYEAPEAIADAVRASRDQGLQESSDVRSADRAPAAPRPAAL